MRNLLRAAANAREKLDRIFVGATLKCIKTTPKTLLKYSYTIATE